VADAGGRHRGPRVPWILFRHDQGSLGRVVVDVDNHHLGLWPWFSRAASSTARTDAPRSRMGTRTLRIASTERTVLVAPRGAGGGTRSIQPSVPARPMVKATAMVTPAGLRARLKVAAGRQPAAARHQTPAGRSRRWHREWNEPGSHRAPGSAGRARWRRLRPPE